MAEAIVAVINTRPHPNADRLAIGMVAGYQVVTTITTETGTLGVYFPADTQLSHEFCHYNNEYRVATTGPVGPNSDTTSKGGYFEANRRIRTISLRGQRSEGYWVPLSSLAFTGVNLDTLKEGDTFSTLGGTPVCNKYMNLATIHAKNANKQQKAKARQRVIPMFHEHTDTKKLRYGINTIPDGARLIITEKLHGTSGRTGHVQVKTQVPDLPWYKRVAAWILGLTTLAVWQHISGSRRVVLQGKESRQNDYYQGSSFREEIHDTLALKHGETLYYEIVGYSSGGAPFMGSMSLVEKSDEVRKALRKQYGDTMVFSYGCEPGTYAIYVYRITVNNDVGDTWELSWDQIKARCTRLGLETVPELYQNVYKEDEDQYEYITSKEQLLDLCLNLSQGCSGLDSTHITEGVCVRVEHPEMFGTTFKYKGFNFCHLEGIRKNSDQVDLEESS
jgi:hypothetical protein